MLTQNEISHPCGPMTAPHGGPVPGGPAETGGDVVLIEYPPMHISKTKMEDSTAAITRLCP
jgi:hypothetical protein